MGELRKFVVALSDDDALTTMAVWFRHEEIRESFAERVFDERPAAERAHADLIKRAEDESPFGCKVPCDEHSRCVGFTPQVWEVALSVTLATEKIKTESEGTS